MSLKHAKRRPMAEINVVPYIDVMLVLLVIFMITAPLITAGVNVDLPQTPDAKLLPTDEEPPLIASVDKEGNYFLSVGDSKNERLDLNQLVTLVRAHRQNNPQAQVMVNGDRLVPYEKVVQLMVVLESQAGVESVGLMTDPIDSP